MTLSFLDRIAAHLALPPDELRRIKELVEPYRSGYHMPWRSAQSVKSLIGRSDWQVATSLLTQALKSRHVTVSLSGGMPCEIFATKVLKMYLCPDVLGNAYFFSPCSEEVWDEASALLGAIDLNIVLLLPAAEVEG